MRAVVADDTLLTREGVVALLTSGGVEVVAQAGDATTLMNHVRVYRPDVCLVDIRMPPTYTDEGIVAATAIRSEFPDIGVLVLSHYIESTYAMRLIQSQPEGIGYVLKERIYSGDVLVDGLRRVAEGETVIDPTIVARLFHKQRTAGPVQELSEREREVLALVAEGLTNQGIGRKLFITDRTVEAHVRQVFTKLGLDESPESNRRVLAVLTYLRSI
ncbi:LuxR family two component transcriptional regulator [Humibacillus xanthopallidus]|uniref:LuxR family two component transcriptional regulator n=1 Tax=Humibacillus xanthopallidus TaxID=412689 RepID=A0A543PM12_9MICO|nr:response regulator transcription factor [Humibacillus xanthopallidus]TQN45120.1 LuxR family two component transcriptional regulator [Humibacillus xanthopallidus]